ncbi:hypothetical protein [Pantoea phage vB_PdeP_F2M1C]|nr:hypothetical protein [Pantoea phage vB_PdeP_F2M1C]
MVILSLYNHPTLEQLKGGGSMLRLLIALLRHRVTWRFLLVLTAALGYAGLTDHLGQLEVAFCSILSCGD